MSSLEKLIQKKKGQQLEQSKPKTVYEGPIIYRGQEINWKNSITRVVKTLSKALRRSQFAAFNVVGIPGSGKTTLAVNIINDLVQKEEEETGEHWQIHWKGAEDLRNLGDLLENLEKFQNHIVIFDDVSKALEKLSGSEQAEVFQQLTTTRHVTGGRLCIGSLYHYSFANLKSVKSQGVVVIYTSCTLTEYGNIKAILTTDKAHRTLARFARIYESAFMNGEFKLKKYDKGQLVTFLDGQPFRPCLVVNLFRAHIALFMKIEGGFQPPNNTKQKLDPNTVIEKVDKPYPRYGRLMLKLMCMQKGYYQTMTPNAVQAWKFLVQLFKDYDIDWEWCSQVLRDPHAKRLYIKKKENRITSDEIVKESKITLGEPDPEKRVIKRTEKPDSLPPIEPIDEMEIED